MDNIWFETNRNLLLLNYKNMEKEERNQILKALLTELEGGDNIYSDEQDKEFFTSEDHAVDVAYSWSAETHGRTMILQRDGIDWMEVVA